MTSLSAVSLAFCFSSAAADSTCCSFETSLAGFFSVSFTGFFLDSTVLFTGFGSTFLGASLAASSGASTVFFTCVSSSFDTFVSLGSVRVLLVSTAGLLVASKSIFPTVLRVGTSALALMTCFLARSSSSFLFFSCSSRFTFSSSSRLRLSSFSRSKRKISFSFLFSSLTSIDASFFPLSAENCLFKAACSSPEIFALGEASISKPLVFKNSTALSREIFNSLKTLFILITLLSDI